MTKIQLHRLAGTIATLRPDWAPASLQAFLERHLAHRPYRDAAVALVACALDPATTTPGRVLEAGPWWSAAATSDVPQRENTCQIHPRARLRIDQTTGAETCAGCHVDQLADDSGATRDRGGRPMPEEARQLLPPSLRERPATPGEATSREETTQ